MTDQQKRRLCNILNSYSGLCMTPDPAQSGVWFHNETTNQIQKGYDWKTKEQAITEARRLLSDNIVVYQNEIPKHLAPFIGFIIELRPLSFAWSLTEIMDTLSQNIDSQTDNAQDLLTWIDTL